MGFKVNVDKGFVWDNEQQQMVIRSKVVVQIVSNHGTVYAEEGPLYCSTAQEIFEATMTLRRRLVKDLVPEPTNRII